MGRARKKYLFFFLNAIFLFPLLGQAVGFQSQLELGALQFANEASPASRGFLEGQLFSEDSDFHRTLAGWGFFETPSLSGTTQGSWGGDLDPVFMRKQFLHSTALTLGRFQPALPLRGEKTQAPGLRLSHRSAVGANWGQNQMDALFPRVTGWVGAGVSHRFGSGVFVQAAYSPLFIPTLGPQLDLSRDTSPQGSRYTRLPPQRVQIGEAVLPLRYEVDAGDLSEILFQHQAFASVGVDYPGFFLQALAWSAPSPDPELDVEGRLRVGEAASPSDTSGSDTSGSGTSGSASENPADVLVVAKPTFPRRHYAALRAHFGTGWFAPEVSWVQELTQGISTFSLALHSRWWIGGAEVHPAFGWLHRFGVKPSGPVQSADYADRLGWLSIALQWGKFRPQVVWEKHFTHPGQWFRMRVDYLLDENFALFSSLSLLTGGDQSYYGAWRSLDSFGVGGRILL